MSTSVSLLPNALLDLFAQVSYSGEMTLADRYGLLAAILDESLTEGDRELIDRLLRAVYRGRIKLVNEFSSAFALQSPKSDVKIEALIFQYCA